MPFFGTQKWMEKGLKTGRKREKLKFGNLWLFRSFINWSQRCRPESAGGIASFSWIGTVFVTMAARIGMSTTFGGAFRIGAIRAPTISPLLLCAYLRARFTFNAERNERKFIAPKLHQITELSCKSALSINYQIRHPQSTKTFSFQPTIFVSNFNY